MVWSLFFRFSYGRLPHNILTLTSRILTEDPTVRLAVFSTTACLNISSTFPLLPSSTYSFRTRSLMPLLHFPCAQRLFSNVRSLRVPRTTSSLVRLFQWVSATHGRSMITRLVLQCLRNSPLSSLLDKLSSQFLLFPDSPQSF
jgi:hypothetical protein